MPRTKRPMRMVTPTLLPPAKDACQVCACDHAPGEPHNPQSLYWQMARQLAGEPTPTWEDALEHVDDATHARWREALKAHHVVIEPRPTAEAE